MKPINRIFVWIFLFLTLAAVHAEEITSMWYYYPGELEYKNDYSLQPYAGEFEFFLGKLISSSYTRYEFDLRLVSLPFFIKNRDWENQPLPLSTLGPGYYTDNTYYFTVGYQGYLFNGTGYISCFLTANQSKLNSGIRVRNLSTTSNDQIRMRMSDVKTAMTIISIFEEKESFNSASDRLYLPVGVYEGTIKLYDNNNILKKTITLSPSGPGMNLTDSTFTKYPYNELAANLAEYHDIPHLIDREFCLDCYSNLGEIFSNIAQTRGNVKYYYINESFDLSSYGDPYYHSTPLYHISSPVYITTDFIFPANIEISKKLGSSPGQYRVFDGTTTIKTGCTISNATFYVEPQGTLHIEAGAKGNFTYVSNGGSVIDDRTTFYNLVLQIYGLGSVDGLTSGVNVVQAGPLILNARPGTGFYFVKWGGDISSQANPVTITMDSDKSVVVYFTNILETLEISHGSHGYTNPAAGTYYYPHGKNVTVRAIPDYHYKFTGWGYPGNYYSTQNPVTITMDRYLHLNAGFAYDKEPL